MASAFAGGVGGVTSIIVVIRVMIEALGHYKILDRIGAGGLGDVYRARDTHLGRTVAVKVPGAELQASGDRRESLQRDARVASVLSHPNIAALYEIGEEEGCLFLVFEFVPGEPLKRVIAGRPLNMRRAVDLAAQMADALAEAHAADIVHGGLTPDTVMITPKGNAKILDFGFVQWKKSAAPAGESDHRIDIEALGVLLFEMLTGRPPSEASPRLGASMPRELDEIVGKALGAYSEGGYEAAATCAAELRSIAAMLDVRAASADPVRVPPPRDRPERRSLGWIILAVIAALAALAGWWRFHS
jgi:serine/threonine protein kinase